ncbi:MAG TPA: hypothetical protein VF447_08270 [Terriglobales bacterium]
MTWLGEFAIVPSLKGLGSVCGLPGTYVPGYLDVAAARLGTWRP